MTTFRLPDLGEGLTESEIVTWHVAEGDVVELNQPLAEVETAKAVVELPSPYAGRIARLHAVEGEVVAVGAPLVDFDVAHDRRAAEAPAPAAAAGAATAADAPAPAEAAPQRHAVLVGYGPQADGDARPRRRARSFETVPYRGRNAAEHHRSTPRAMPPVRMLARQLGVDLATVHGSGPDGLIRRSDVEASADAPTAGAANSAEGSPEAAVAAPPHTNGSARESSAAVSGRTDRASTYVPVTGLRKHTAKAVTDSAFTAPHAAVFSTVDVTETLTLVRRAASRPGTHPPTFLSLACRAVVLAAQRTPEANARFDAEAGHIEQFGRVDLGVAVSTDRGLVVTTIPDADTLGAGALAERVAAQAAKAREGALTPAEVTGSTLTVTNVGVFGVDGGIPILNPGQSVIVAVGTIRTRPWEHQGQVALREVATVTVSFDHRVLDGAQASAFLCDVTELLSDPAIALTR